MAKGDVHGLRIYPRYLCLFARPWTGLARFRLGLNSLCLHIVLAGIIVDRIFGRWRGVFQAFGISERGQLRHSLVVSQRVLTAFCAERVLESRLIWTAIF